MPNWCYNTITLSGRCKNFCKQLEKHDYGIQGFEILPGKNKRCIFSLEKITENMYSFESKWIPPIEELVEKARKSKFSFEIDYEELSMGIYGKAIYNCKNDSLVEYDLPDEILNRRDFDDNGNFILDGKLCDQEYEMEWLENELEKLINNKN